MVVQHTNVSPARRVDREQCCLISDDNIEIGLEASRPTVWATEHENIACP